MINNHITFFLYTIIVLHSILGYGYFFSKILFRNNYKINIGYIGLIGFFFISLISIFTSFFLAHGFKHNIILHFFGFISFIFFLRSQGAIRELKYLLSLFIIIFIGLYVYKNHDDFPYYHLTYALNLSENGYLVGTGNFSHGFRTFSSLFYFHSTLYLPGIKFYLFHSGPFFIILFFNYIVIKKLIFDIKFNNINFIFYFLFLSLIFINIAFYRISEHGTDRSAQILLILIFSIFFEILYIQKKKNLLFKISIMLLLIFLASSMKAIYYLYLLLIPAIIIKKKSFKVLFIRKNTLLYFFILLSFCLNLITNYFNTGCFLYPASSTCIVKQDWSIPKEEVISMSNHYEWWSKAGGGPNYKSELVPEVYIKDFNWVKNWVNRHFFNKVSDTLIGILTISFIVIFLFKYFSKTKINPSHRIDFFGFMIPIIFLIEWFLNHPAMRYGGYVLFAIPIFLISSLVLQKYYIEKKKIYQLVIFFIIFSLIAFDLRNLIRLEKEKKIYSYKLIENPFFYVKKVDFEPIVNFGNFIVYSTKNNDMCWASKTPCSYNRNIRVKNFLWMKMIFRYEE